MRRVPNFSDFAQPVVPWSDVVGFVRTHCSCNRASPVDDPELPELPTSTASNIPPSWSHNFPAIAGVASRPWEEGVREAIEHIRCRASAYSN